MRRGFIGIISVLVMLLVLVGGCGDDEAGPVAQVSALTATGVMYPGTVTISLEGDFDDEAWTNPGDVMANDGNYASANFAGSGANKETWVLKATNFGFAVPTGATIDGISVEIERYESVKYSLQDALVQLTKNGTTRVGDNKADTATYWTTSLGIRQYGNATDLWGTNWTAAEINASTFGVHFAVRKPGSGSGRIAYVDFIRITVYYSADSAPVADPQSGLTVNSCSTLTVTLTGSDPDSDPLTYMISTLPLHGDLYDGTGTGGTKITSVPYAVTDGTHKVTYQPTSSYSGADSFGFKVNDGKVDSAEATISITVSDGRSWWYQDSDGDNYGNAAVSQQACNQPPGYVGDNTDCDDLDDTVYPGAPELCDGKDNDCNGSIDEGGGPNWYQDNDGDNYGNPAVVTQNCTQPSGYVSDHTDCDDNNINVNPGATEVCNGIDDDCDGNIDEGVCTTYYRDHDGDTYGVTGDSQCLCSPTGEYTATQGGDCNDSDANEHLGQTWYKDADNDGYSDGTNTTQCARPTNYKLASELTATSGDCDDSDWNVRPGATEACNGIDDDCDGSYDEDFDGDGDTYTSCGTRTTDGGSCAVDCDDTDPIVYPGAPELCDGKDNDCNTLIDDGAGSLWYQDNDVDGYGNSTVSQQACSAPAGYVADNTDCDDNDKTIYPGAPELSDGKDNDCDGSIDEGIGPTVVREPMVLPYLLCVYCTEGGRVIEPTGGNFPYSPGEWSAYYPGTVVNLTAVPDAGYCFVGWTGGSGIIADVSAATTTIIMNRDCVITANFAEIPETPEIGQYNLTASSTAGGSVSVPGEGTSTYDAGTAVNVVARADAGYMFVNWTGNVTTIANVNGATTTITMNGDYSIVANFAQIPPGQVTLTISSSAVGPVITTPSTTAGSVTTPGEATFTYDEGTVVDLEAEPEESCRFFGWTGDVDDVADVTAAATTITMNDNYSITAMFKFGTGCFIATAAYGTPMAEEIQILREFRDEYLLANPVGEALVELYYTVSPPIAEFITEHPGLKPIVRAGLTPAVAMSTIAVNTSPAEKATIVGLLVLSSVALAVWATRRRHKGSQYA